MTFIFDFDGTIANTPALFRDIYNVLSKEFNLREVSDEEWQGMRGQKARELLKKMNVSLFRLPAILKRAKELLFERIGFLKPFEGMPEALKSIKEKGNRLGILTSNNEDNVKTFFKNNNLDFFDFVYSENNLFGKDKALNKIIEKEGLEKENTVYLGDEDRDIEAAKKMGLKSIAVAWGVGTEELLAKEEPDFLAKHPQDLVFILEELN